MGIEKIHIIIGIDARLPTLGLWALGWILSQSLWPHTCGYLPDRRAYALAGTKLYTAYLWICYLRI